MFKVRRQDVCACIIGQCHACSLVALIHLQCMQGADKLHSPMHLQVSQVSAKAKQAVEAMGGSVTTVYYNPLGMRALLRPEWFAHKGVACMHCS